MRSEKASFPLFENIKTVIAETQHYVVRNINSAMILAYFQIGKMIVEDEQRGRERAGYAKETIARLSKELNRGLERDILLITLSDFANFI
jgi:hypothetical protein